jgi:hypothetical protein
MLEGHPLVQVVVRVIAENSGLNATEVIGQLKAAHAKGDDQAGLDIETGQAKDLATIGIVDLFSAKVPCLFGLIIIIQMIIFLLFLLLLSSSSSSSSSSSRTYIKYWALINHFDFGGSNQP